MSFFDKVYDNMSLSEVCSRLPGELAVKSVKRRIYDLNSLTDFIKNNGSSLVGKNKEEIVKHVSSIVHDIGVNNVFNSFDKDDFPKLFNLVDEDCRKSLKNSNVAYSDVKLLFNVCDENDIEGLKDVLDSVLAESEIKFSHVRAVLRKVSRENLLLFFDYLLKDSRPEVRVQSICANTSRFDLLSENQKLVILKSWSKCIESGFSDLHCKCTLSLSLFTKLKVKERFNVLEDYLKTFPFYMKMNPFCDSPTMKEFDLILFPGSVNRNEQYVNIKNLYEKITVLEKPKDDDDE